MGGPAFALSTRFKTELTFKDFKEIRDHPMASSFVLTLDDLLKMLARNDIQTLRDKKFDISSLDETKLQALVDKGEVSESSVTMLKLVGNILTLCEEVDPVTKVDAQLFMAGLFSVDAEIRGHGFAELIGTIVRAATFSDREWRYENVHKKYLKAYDMPKYLELYKEEEKEAAYDDAPMMMEAPADYEDAPMMEAPAEMEPLGGYSRGTRRYGLGPQVGRSSDYDKQEEQPLIMQEEEARPTNSRGGQPKTVKSKLASTVSEDVYGDTEQMRQIKAYI